MRFSFGRHSLDAERSELRADGHLVSVQAKVLEFIVYLVICLIGYAVGALARRFR